MWRSLQVMTAPLAMIATMSIDDRLCLLPFWPSLSSPLLSASSASSYATTFATIFAMLRRSEMERYTLRFGSSSFPGFHIITTLAHVDTAGCQPVRNTACASSSIFSASHFQSRHMSPYGTLSRHGILVTDRPKRGCPTTSLAMDQCASPPRGSLKCWSCSFWGKDSHLTISYFFGMVFAFFPSLSVRASTAAPFLWVGKICCFPVHTSPLVHPAVM
jgi:hypothetical protein